MFVSDEWLYWCFTGAAIAVALTLYVRAFH